MWYKGVCDTLLSKIIIWDVSYDTGTIAATRPFLTAERTPRYVDKVVKRGHKIPFTKLELQNLHRLLKADKEGVLLAEEISNIMKIWPKGILQKNGSRIVDIAFYPEHVKQMRTILERAKSSSQFQSVEDFIAESSKEGKAPFEL